MTAQRLDDTGRPVGAPLTADCERLAWQQGTDLLSWLPLPSGAPGGATTWRVSLKAGPLVAIRPQVGPLPLETGAVDFATQRSITSPVTFQTRPGA